MSANQGRFNTTISPMPSNTPGRRKGSQESQRQKSENRKPKAERRPNTEGRKPAERLDVPSGCAECTRRVIRVLAQRLNRTTKAAAAAATEVKKTSLGLAVEKRGNGLLVSWDGNAPIVSKANFGMLLIRGSGVSRDVPLTTDELRAGGSVY